MIDLLNGDAEIRAAISRLRQGGDREDALSRVAWSVIAEPGDSVAGVLIERLGPAQALRFALSDAGFDLSEKSIEEARRRWRPRARPTAVRDALRGAGEVGAHLVLPGDAGWCDAFDDLGEHAPTALWVRGDPAHLVRARRASLVGARASTAYGDHVAADLAGDLAGDAVTIVSGGAYGIDGAAHRAALGAGGSTVAFLAGGVDRAYPAGHQQLFQRIRDEGAVVSELPCGAAPTKWRFLARNRLIAALGQATIVVEAGWRSGSLNTAGHAASLGRALGAVPGPVTSAASAGCHRLLREYDAQCVTTAAEVRELLGATQQGLGEVGRSAEPSVDPDRTRLLDALSTRTARAPIDLARASGLSVERVRSLLGLLGLDGAVTQHDDGWRRAPR